MDPVKCTVQTAIPPGRVGNMLDHTSALPGSLLAGFGDPVFCSWVETDEEKLSSTGFRKPCKYPRVQSASLSVGHGFFDVDHYPESCYKDTLSRVSRIFSAC